VLALLLLLASCAQEDRRGPVVLAAASTQDALQAAADAWEEKGHARPLLSFAGTSSLARQVEQGAPADIFVSADRQWMDWLQERGLVETTTRREIAGNRLVFVAGDEANADLGQEEFLALARRDRVAVADTQAVPAGRYAREALERMKIWDVLEPRLVPAENVRAALALVERGEARFGIVYASDAEASDKAVIAREIDARYQPAIAYPAALLTASRHPDAAKLLRFLSGDEAAAIFRAYGFAPAEPCPSC
jgi:molybdate transport system substrate-binding protein